MRNHPGQGPGERGCALWVFEALRRGAGRSGGVPARPQAETTHIKVPEGPADDRFVYLSDVLPTAWQAVEYAAIPRVERSSFSGSGRSATWHVVSPSITAPASSRWTWSPNGLQRARDRGIEVIDLTDHEDDLGALVRDRTAGRGPDSVIDAVGMEAHGSPAAKFLQGITALLPDAVGAPLSKKAGIDRLAALFSAIDIVRRGGTISVIGVYGGAADPLPLVTMFDKQIQLRMGQANVLRWVDDIMPLLVDEDPLGVDTFATHHLPLADAPHAYEIFQKKQEGAVKIVLHP